MVKGRGLKINDTENRVGRRKLGAAKSVTLVLALCVSTRISRLGEYVSAKAVSWRRWSGICPGVTSYAIYNDMYARTNVFRAGHPVPSRHASARSTETSCSCQGAVARALLHVFSQTWLGQCYFLFVRLHCNIRFHSSIHRTSRTLSDVNYFPCLVSYLKRS